MAEDRDRSTQITISRAAASIVARTRAGPPPGGEVLHHLPVALQNVDAWAAASAPFPSAARCAPPRSRSVIPPSADATTTERTGVARD